MASYWNSESIIPTVQVVLQVKKIELQQNTITWRNADAPQTQPVGRHEQFNQGTVFPFFTSI